MRKVKRTRAKSLLVGKLPEGCRLCIQGAKLVLFVTGLCDRGCYYCPLSERRRGGDVVYANERPVRSWNDILREAREMDALGTGLTGGSPTLRFKRVIKFAQKLKREFGRDHHVHLYCCEHLTPQQLTELKRAGIDEIRFHGWAPELVFDALQAGLDAGVELPAIPGTTRELIDLLKRLEEVGPCFMNLNELEFSETNARELMRRGFRIKAETSMAALGSEETAISVLKWASIHTDLSVHYCPSSLKDSVQLKNRLLRKAKNIAKPHEEITEEGLLYKGILRAPSGELAGLRKRLIARYQLDPLDIHLDREKSRLEMNWRLAVKLSKLEPALDLALVEEYPTHDRLETTLIPLGE
jgi:hypothetical protein